VPVVAWAKDDPFGVEFAEIELRRDSLTAHGVAIGTSPTPYRLDYTLETGTGWITSRLAVAARMEGRRRTLELRRDGRWFTRYDDEDEQPLPESFDAALDCDLGLSPVTNLMPVLRHGIREGGGPVVLTTAWVSVPDLALTADEQRYSFVREGAVRFEAVDGSFTAELTLDDDGIVVDYPGIARRLR
jgi:uncharacterized protein